MDYPIEAMAKVIGDTNPQFRKTKAALRALKDNVTDEMINAGREELKGRHAYRASCHMFVAMIDAALKTEPSPHASDCAVHNMPAFPNGPCDCQPEEQSDATRE